MSLWVGCIQCRGEELVAARSQVIEKCSWTVKHLLISTIHASVRCQPLERSHSAEGSRSVGCRQ